MTEKLPVETLIARLKETLVSYPFLQYAYKHCAEEDKAELTRQINILKLTGYGTGIYTREAYYAMLESIQFKDWHELELLPDAIAYFYKENDKE